MTALHSFLVFNDLHTLWNTSHFFWIRQWQPTPVLLPGKSHGWRSLVGCSPWGCEESDTTERLHFQFSLSCIGEGNGNPLQCSCLENPRDGGAWWASVYGVAQSRMRLKWLSSSSSSRFFCKISLNACLLEACLWLYWDSAFWARIPQKWYCVLLSASYQSIYDIKCFIDYGISFNHLIKVSVGFLFFFFCWL